MIACVGATDGWGVHACLSSHSHGVIARPCSCRGGEPRECLEVQPQLTDVIRHFLYSIRTCRCTSGSVAAGVSRVPDVGVVGGDRGTTGGGRDHTADTEPSSAAPTGGPRPAGALRGGVAGPCRRGGAAAGAVVIGELDHAEQRELL